MKLSWVSRRFPKRVYVADDPYLRLSVYPEGIRLQDVDEPGLLVRERVRWLPPEPFFGTEVRDGTHRFRVGWCEHRPIGLVPWMLRLPERLLNARWYCPSGSRDWHERHFSDEGCYRPFWVGESFRFMNNRFPTRSGLYGWVRARVASVELYPSLETLLILVVFRMRDCGHQVGRVYYSLSPEPDAFVWYQLELLGVSVPTGGVVDLSSLRGMEVLARIDGLAEEAGEYAVSVLYRAEVGA